MQEDPNMTDVEWSAGISLFYVGYIISQVPAYVIIAKGKPRILLSCCMLAWSAVKISMKSGWSFMLSRFLVGVTEGPFLPAVSLMTSSWYTKEESPLRMGSWHAGNIISNCISGLLAAGILTNMDGISAMHAWQWFFIIEEVVSIAVGLLGFGLLPAWPSSKNCFYFHEEERALAQYRADLSACNVSEDDEGIYWDGVSRACADPFTWMFAAIYFFLIIAQSFKDFLPSVCLHPYSHAGRVFARAPFGYDALTLKRPWQCAPWLIRRPRSCY